jgi:uncharacterized protein
MGAAMNAKPRRDDRDFAGVVEGRFPGLVDRVRRLVESAERAYGGKGKDEGSSFLWEHTVHVASFALRIARLEKREPLPAVLTALFHDAGKFRRGRYHAGRAPEEAASADIARTTLRGFGAPSALIRDVAAALEALYNERRPPRMLAAVVHDADFLAKAGTLGVAQFFVKSTLRGRTLSGAVTATLSKELTYASVLPLNMRTEAGRRQARTKSRETLRFFRRFIADLNEAAPPGFRLAKLRIRIPGTPHLIRRSSRVSPEFLGVRLVVPVACDRCGGAWRYEHAIERGVKCRELLVSVRCRGCGAASEISFCLPELG